jgi:gamma-glutamylputrescine oxidase
MSERSTNYYLESSAPEAARPALPGDVSVDVCVVGAGIAGCSTALQLAGRGYRVALIDAERVGFGASGRSGAQAIFGYACGQAKLQAQLGAADARRLWDISVEGLDLVRNLIAQHHIDCDYVSGQMHVAIKPRHETELRAEVDELHEQYGYRSVRYMDREETRAAITSERYSGALFDSNSGHLHPLKYTRGLARAAERAGASIYEHTAMTHLEPGRTASEASKVHTSRGVITARHVAICGNALLGKAVPALARKIMAVGTYIVATQPLGADRAAALITNNAAVTDINWVLDYFRRTADHRLLFGGRVSYSGLDAFASSRATQARMLRVFPQLSDVEIEHSWGGYVDITLSRAPHFGRLAPNVYFLQGFSGHGIVLTGIGGKLIADAIAGSAERFDVFGRLKHADFPGGMALRRPALVLAMLYYRLRDML